MKALIGTLALLLLVRPGFAQSDTPNDFPMEYKRLVAAAVQRVFNDPRSVIDAKISKPVADERHPKHGSIWEVCMEANAKNAYGGYAGLQATWFFINQGAVVDVSNWRMPYEEQLSSLKREIKQIDREIDNTVSLPFGSDSSLNVEFQNRTKRLNELYDRKKQMITERFHVEAKKKVSTCDLPLEQFPEIQTLYK